MKQVNIIVAFHSKQIKSMSKNNWESSKLDCLIVHDISIQTSRAFIRKHVYYRKSCPCTLSQFVSNEQIIYKCYLANISNKVNRLKCLSKPEIAIAEKKHSNILHFFISHTASAMIQSYTHSNKPKIYIKLPDFFYTCWLNFF